MKLRAAGDTASYAYAASSQGNGGPGSNYSQFESIWVRSQGDPTAAKDSSAYKTLMGVSDDGLSVSGYIDTPEAIKGMQLYQSLFSKGITPMGAVRNQFAGGQAATYLGGLLFTNRFRTPGKEPPFKWGVSPPPKGKIVFSSNTSDAPMIWSKSKHPAEAAALLAFLCNGIALRPHLQCRSIRCDATHFSLYGEPFQFSSKQPSDMGFRAERTRPASSGRRHHGSGAAAPSRSIARLTGDRTG